MEPPNALMMTYILRYMPDARHHSLVCSAGSQGYHALKEMLLSGVPGNTLLIESGDLREVVVADTSDDNEGEGSTNDNTMHAALIYTFDEVNPSDPDYASDVGNFNVSHVSVFTNMPSLPYGILSNCVGLTSVDLSPLTPATTAIQDFFLSRCTGLKSIDLGPLTHVREIQNCFLGGCRGLTDIDLTPLSSVSVIKGSFLSRCAKLKNINLTPLSGVTRIEGSFLEGCSGLTSIDLSPLSHLTEIDSSFMEECTGLVSVDLRPLNRVVEIHRFFLWGCSRLEEVHLCPSVATIALEYGFIKNCPNLKVLDLSMSTQLDMDVTRDLLAIFKDSATCVVLPSHLVEETTLLL